MSYYVIPELMPPRPPKGSEVLVQVPGHAGASWHGAPFELPKTVPDIDLSCVHCADWSPPGVGTSILTLQLCLSRLVVPYLFTHFTHDGRLVSWHRFGDPSQPSHRNDLSQDGSSPAQLNSKTKGHRLVLR
jgi:hypothetical protein